MNGLALLCPSHPPLLSRFLPPFIHLAPSLSQVCEIGHLAGPRPAPPRLRLLALVMGGTV